MLYAITYFLVETPPWPWIKYEAIQIYHRVVVVVVIVVVVVVVAVVTAAVSCSG